MRPILLGYSYFMWPYRGEEPLFLMMSKGRFLPNIYGIIALHIKLHLVIPCILRSLKEKYPNEPTTFTTYFSSMKLFRNLSVLSHIFLR